MRDGAWQRRPLGPGPGDEGFFPLLLSSQVLQHGMWQVDCGPWHRPLGA